MKINYFESRKQMCEYFNNIAKNSFGYYRVSENGDFFKTTEARWSEDRVEMIYPDWAVLFNLMREDRIEFQDIIHKLSCGG